MSDVTATFPADPPDELLPTRQSLLARLRDWNDQDSWREFFDTYWRLIFNVARQAGLSDTEAQDVVQETLLAVAKKMPDFRYDPEKGSFKAWLLLNVRSRIAEHWRRRLRRDRLRAEPPTEDAGETTFLQRIPDAREATLDDLWQKEWESNLLRTALERTKAKVSARQFLIFDLATLKETPLAKITRTLGVNVAQVYLAKHRVGKVFKAELGRLRQLEA